MRGKNIGRMSFHRSPINLDNNETYSIKKIKNKVIRTDHARCCHGARAKKSHDNAINQKRPRSIEI